MGVASGWNLWVWLVGVAVRRYIHVDILIIIITFPYSTCISSFFGSSIFTCLFIFRSFISMNLTFLQLQLFNILKISANSLGSWCPALSSLPHCCFVWLQSFLCASNVILDGVNVLSTNKTMSLHDELINRNSTGDYVTASSRSTTHC